jgi:hypothetical protein
MARCLHRKCGVRFAGVAAFDRHLRWVRRPPWVVCADPVEVGLVEGPNGWKVNSGDLRADGSGGMSAYPEQGCDAPSATYDPSVASS